MEKAVIGDRRRVAISAEWGCLQRGSWAAVLGRPAIDGQGHKGDSEAGEQVEGYARFHEVAVAFHKRRPKQVVGTNVKKREHCNSIRSLIPDAVPVSLVAFDVFKSNCA
jgi:hypothetical protein